MLSGNSARGNVSRLALRSALNGATRSPLLPLLALAILLLAVPPLGDFPVNDDWNHAAAVRGLVERGRLEIGPTTSASLYLQALWGAAFARVLGFSFDALRLSTLVLTALALVGFHRLLAELYGLGRAVVGCLLLLFNPLFVNLGYSFMTDVPFLCLAVWSMAVYVRALRRSPPAVSALLAGSALAGGACLVRQIGVLLPLAALVGLLLRGERRKHVPLVSVLATVGPALIAVGIGWALDQQRGPIHQEPLRWTLARWTEQPGSTAIEAVSRLPVVGMLLGLFTLPLSIALLAHPRRLLATPAERRLAAVLLLLVATATREQLSRDPARLLLLHQPDVLTTRGFLVDESFFDSNETVPASLALPAAAPPALTVLAAVGLLLLVVAVARAVCRASSQRTVVAPLAMGLLSLAVVCTYFDFYDRYVLSVLPWALVAVLTALRDIPGDRSRASWPWAAVALCVLLLAGWSAWWEREYLARRAATWQAGLELVRLGVPADEIDGGYEWNGWHQRDAAMAEVVERAKTDGSGRRLNDYIITRLQSPKARWVLAFAPPRRSQGGRVLVEVPYWRGQAVYGIERRR